MDLLTAEPTNKLEMDTVGWYVLEQMQSALPGYSLERPEVRSLTGFSAVESGIRDKT